MYVSTERPDLASVPCLAGTDVKRYRTSLAIERKDGRLFDTFMLGIGYATPLEKVGDTVLRGWGELDGPAVDVSCEGTTHAPLSIPRAEWEALERWAAESRLYPGEPMQTTTPRALNV